VGRVIPVNKLKISENIQIPLLSSESSSSDEEEADLLSYKIDDFAEQISKQ